VSCYFVRNRDSPYSGLVVGKKVSPGIKYSLNRFSGPPEVKYQCFGVHNVNTTTPNYVRDHYPVNLWHRPRFDIVNSSLFQCSRGNIKR